MVTALLPQLDAARDASHGMSAVMEPSGLGPLATARILVSLPSNQF